MLHSCRKDGTVDAWFVAVYGVNLSVELMKTEPCGKKKNVFIYI